MAWTYTDDYTLLPNIYVRSHFNNGVLSHYQLYPCNGYVLWIPSGDEYMIDENGDFVLDNDGNPILLYHYYTWGGATAPANYDFSTNTDNFQAILYESGMTVYGGVQPPLVDM